ncbi:MAG: hypothetical protein IPK69_03460 [Phycisphaerales bacterium]|nr:MAG: hypothetical protein IPK69_03460 [Phycisphaerales bacterium]
MLGLVTIAMGFGSRSAASLAVDMTIFATTTATSPAEVVPVARDAMDDEFGLIVESLLQFLNLYEIRPVALNPNTDEAQLFVDTYNTSGIRQNLTPADISSAIDTCKDALAWIANHPGYFSNPLEGDFVKAVSNARSDLFGRQ